MISWIINHRLQREAKILEKLKNEEFINELDLVKLVYDDVDSKLHPIALWSLKAHLVKLKEEKLVANDKAEDSWLKLMIIFTLGCFYLLNALAILWLDKSGFNLIGFIFNKRNHGIYLIYESIFFLFLCLLSLIDSQHFSLAAFSYALNKYVLSIFNKNDFYSSRDSFDLIGQQSIVNISVVIFTLAGVFTILISL